MMKLETDTPLSDVIKYIKDATQKEADTDLEFGFSRTFDDEGPPTETAVRVFQGFLVCAESE